MRKKIAIIVVVGIGVGALISLWGTQVSLSNLLTQPLTSLLNSPHQLQTGVLEVSENIEPVQEATRRLFKPLGVVHLIQRFPPSSSSDNSSQPPKH